MHLLLCTRWQWDGSLVPRPPLLPVIAVHLRRSCLSSFNLFAFDKVKQVKLFYFLRERRAHTEKSQVSTWMIL